MVRDRTSFGAAVRGIATLLALGAPDIARTDPPAQPLPLEEHAIASERIRELSGLVASRKHTGVFWTHSDSGDHARIFAIDRTGKLLSEFRIQKARNVDWEDITADDSGHLYLADIGNNRSRRRDLAVYRIAEPDPARRQGSVTAERVLRLRYADQAMNTNAREHDAEAIVWHAGSLYIFTKHRSDACTTVYRLPDAEGAEERALQPLATLRASASALPFTGNVTGASLSADGKTLALLTYTEIRVFTRSGSGDELLPLQLAGSIALDGSRTGQVEGIAWDGASLLVGNEGRRLFRLPEPALARSRPASTDPACGARPRAGGP